jgi:NFU1 iron-sulfur cluster scaffold homolog, mitochondrial
MITVTDTPNPESKKFVFDIDIVASGSKEIKSIKECSDIKFAERIFASGLSELIYIDTNFVTIKKTAGKNWDEIKQDILNILLEEIGADFKPFSFAKTTDFKDEISKRIEEVLNEKIRPAVAMDGGDIQLKSYKDGIAEVMLKGSCAGCPSSVVTLKQGVERMIKHYVPEVHSVIAVNLE